MALAAAKDSVAVIASGVDVVTKLWDLGVKISTAIHEAQKVSSVFGSLEVVTDAQATVIHATAAQPVVTAIVTQYAPAVPPPNGVYVRLRVGFVVGKSGKNSRKFVASALVAHVNDPADLYPLLSKGTVVAQLQDLVKNVSAELIGIKARSMRNWIPGVVDALQTRLVDGVCNPFVLLLNGTNTKLDPPTPPEPFKLSLHLDVSSKHVGPVQVPTVLPVPPPPPAPVPPPAPAPVPRKIQFPLIAGINWRWGH